MERVGEMFTYTHIRVLQNHEPKKAQKLSNAYNTKLSKLPEIGGNGNAGIFRGLEPRLCAYHYQGIKNAKLGLSMKIRSHISMRRE